MSATTALSKLEEKRQYGVTYLTWIVRTLLPKISIIQKSASKVHLKIINSWRSKVNTKQIPPTLGSPAHHAFPAHISWQPILTLVTVVLKLIIAWKNTSILEDPSVFGLIFSGLVLVLRSNNQFYYHGGNPSGPLNLRNWYSWTIFTRHYCVPL